MDRVAYLLLAVSLQPLPLAWGTVLLFRPE